MGVYMGKRVTDGAKKDLLTSLSCKPGWGSDLCVWQL